MMIQTNHTRSIISAITILLVCCESKVAVSKEPETECFQFGCPVTPEDFVHEHVQVKLGYGTATSDSDENESASDTNIVESTGFVQAATLTLTGYKGGALADQINQDRALIVAPFSPMDGDGDDMTHHSIKKSKENAIVTESSTPFDNLLLGVFDGHGKGGEIVSQFVIDELPTRLSQAFTASSVTLDDDTIQSILNETFVELDKDAPVDDHGGCTASILLKLQSKLYVANTGDSRTFIASFDPKTNSSDIIYITREDKAELADERERIEKMGGSVYIPPPEKPHASSRVIYVDYKTGYRNGLAMSRSIGDRAFGRLGVIPDPLIHVIDLSKYAKEVGSQGECSIDENGDETCTIKDELEFYVVSGTDGLFDELELEEITDSIGPNLFLNNGENLMNIASDLVVIAAQRWGSRYRDDIAISVARLT